jgi:hypothetical protein
MGPLTPPQVTLKIRQNDSFGNSERETYSTKITSTGMVQVSLPTAHRLNSSFVTATPTLTSALSVLLAVTPGGAANWILFSSFSGLIYSGSMLIGSGVLVTCSRFSREIKICLSCEKVELHECRYPEQRTRYLWILAHLTRLCKPRTVVGTKVHNGVFRTL